MRSTLHQASELLRLSIMLWLLVPLTVMATLPPPDLGTDEQLSEESYWLLVSPQKAPPAGLSEQSQRIASRMDRVVDGQMNPSDFFRYMASEGITMADLAAFKADYIRLESSRAEQSRGLSPTDSVPVAMRAWNDHFGVAERRLLEVRRWSTEQAFSNAIRRYVGENPNFPYVVRMDVGTWADAGWSQYRFEGDIDFTVIAAQVENGVVLRDMYNAELRRITGLDMGQLEAHATAHRRPTADVYISDAAATWAEQDALRRGKLQEVVIDRDGAVRLRSIDEPLVQSYVFANLLNNISLREGRGDLLGALLTDEPMQTDAMRRESAGGEPAIALELLRHLNTDALRAQLAPHERIIRLAKFVNRSHSDSGLSASDAALAQWAGEVNRIRQDNRLSYDQRIRQILNASAQIMGNPQTNAALDSAMRRLGQRSAALIQENATILLDQRLAGLDAMRPGEARTQAQRQLLNDLQAIQRAYGQVGVDFPPQALQAMVHLGESLQTTPQRIPASEIQKIRRLLDESANNPRSLELALAIAWDRMGHYYQRADHRLNRINEVLDYLDNNTIARLRAINTELQFGGIDSDGRFAFRVPIPIGAINDRLNASMLGTISDSVPFKAFNLYQELASYGNAIFYSSDDWGEAMSNLSTEIFRNRVPAGTLIEAIVMENYVRAGVAVVYLMFPTLAVPEALYGLGMALAERRAQAWRETRYEEMVDELYSGSEFILVDGASRLQRITLSKGVPSPITVERDDVWTLPQRVPYLSNVLVPQVRNSPEIILFHELLEHPAVSSGQIASALLSPWPRRYANLTAPGRRLWEDYEEAVWEVTRRYFREVIRELEQRHDFIQGAGLRRIEEIEQELNCIRPILSLSGDIDRDRPRMEALLEHWDQIKEVETEINQLRSTWQAYFLLAPRPRCTEQSFAETADKAQTELDALQDAVQRASAAVTEIVGRDQADHAVLQPAVEAYLDFTFQPSGDPARAQAQQRYRSYLDSLRADATPPQVVISGPTVIEQGVSSTFTGTLDRPLRAANYSWWLDDDRQQSLHGGSDAVTLHWTPQQPGPAVLHFLVASNDPDVDVVAARHDVRVLAPEDIPHPELRLETPVQVVRAGELLPIQAITTRSGLNGRDFDLYRWLIDGQPAGSFGPDPQFLFDSTQYADSEVVIRVEGRSVVPDTGQPVIHDTDELRIEVGPPPGLDPDDDAQAADSLRVVLHPQTKQLKAGDPLNLQASILARAAPNAAARRPTIQTQWSVNGEAVGTDTTNLRFDTRTIQTNEVHVQVHALQLDPETSELLYSGHAERRIRLLPEISLGVELDDHPLTLHETQILQLCVRDRQSGVSYEWQRFRATDPERRDHMLRTHEDSPEQLWDTTAKVGPCMSRPGNQMSGQVVRYRVLATHIDSGTTALATSGDIQIIQPDWETLDTESEPIDEPAPEVAETEAPDLAELTEQRAEQLEACEQWTASRSGGYGTTEVTWDISNLPEGTEFDFAYNAMSVPDKFIVEYPPGQVVHDTGWRGSASRAERKPGLYPGGVSGPGRGSVDTVFDKTTANSFRVTVMGPESGTAWNYRIRPRCNPDAVLRIADGPTRVTYGSSVRWTASAEGGLEVSSVAWHATPNLTFEQGVSADLETVITFDRLGRVLLWAEGQPTDSNLPPVESQQVEIEVVPPRFELVFDPPPGQARVGDEVQVEVRSDPAIPAELVDHRWVQPTARSTHTDNASRIGFTVGDGDRTPLEDIPLHVWVRVPRVGDTLEEIQASYSGQPYEVEISEPTHRGPTPQTWDPERGGLVDVPRGQVVTGQEVRLNASVRPTPPGEVRYRWSVQPDGARTHGTIGSSQTFSASNAGSYTVEVVATNAAGLVLGRTSRTIAVVQDQPPPAAAPDGAEPPDADAQPAATVDPDALLTPPDVIDLAQAGGQLDAGTREETHTIQVPRHGSLRVDVKATGDLRVNLRLTDASGNQLSSAGSSGSPHVTRDDLAPGTYFVRVRRGSGEGNYRLSSQLTSPSLANDAGPNNSFEEVQQHGASIPLNRHSTGLLGYVDQGQRDTEDWFRFETSEHGRVEVAVSAEESLRVNLRLDDAGGNQLTSASSSQNPSLARDDLAPGSYFIRVRRGSGQGGYVITPTLDAVRFASDREPNDSREEAQPIPLGQPTEGLLGYVDQGQRDTEDWFRFETTEHGRVEVAVNAEDSLRVNLRLDDADGSQLTSASSSQNPSLARDDLAPGTYFVRVRRGSGQGGYVITPSLEAIGVTPDVTTNDSREQAKPIPLGQDTAGLLGYVDQGQRDTEDWFRFETGEHGRVEVTVSAKDSLRVNMRLDDAEANQLTSASSSQNPSLARDDLAPGTYFVRVRRGSGQGSYVITPTLDAVRFRPDREPNDSREQAQSIPLGRDTEGLLGYMDRGQRDTEDWFRFEISQAGRIEVAVSAEDSLRVNLRLDDAGGNQLSSASSSHNPRLARDDLPAGTYFIRVRRGSGQGGYSVRPAFTPGHDNH